MKKLIFCFILLFGPMCACESVCWEPISSAEVRVAYFYPHSGRVRDLCADHWTDFQLELHSKLCPAWELWLNTSYSQNDGRSHVKSFCCEEDGCDKKFKKTMRVKLLPITLGVKRYFYCDGCFRPYVGAGIGVVYARVSNNLKYVNSLENRFGFAALLKLGAVYDFSTCVFLDVFADWAINCIDFDKKRGCNSQYHPQMGGLKAGLGLGYRF